MDYHPTMKRFFHCAATALLLATAGSPASADIAAKAPLSNSALDSEVFYRLLVGELSAQKGDNAVAYTLILEAARKTNSAPLYERAMMLALTSRSSEAALQAAQEWERAFPNSPEASLFVLQILIELNRTAQTVEPLKHMLSTSKSADRLQSIALLPQFYARATDKKLAATLVEQALTPDLNKASSGPLAWTSIGLLRLAANDPSGALDAARRGAQLNPLAQEPIFLALYLSEPSNAEAQGLVQKFLDNKPTPGFRIAYVRKLLDTRRFDEAYQQVRLLTAQNPDLTEPWLIQGSLELQDKKLPQAQASLQAYVSLSTAQPKAADTRGMDSGLVHAYLLLCEIAMKNDKLEEASAYLDRIDSPQDILRVQSHRASLLARQGKFAQARALIRNTPESQATDAREKVKAEVQLLREYKQYQDAYQILNEAVSKAPKDVDLLYDLATMAEKVGKLPEMELLLRRIIASQPDYHAAYNALGYALADRKLRLTEARELIQKALQFAPNDPYIVDSLGWVEFRSGNLAEALRLLQNAYQARPDAEIAAHLGEVLWSMGKQKQAMEIWEQGNALNPENETLMETMRRLNSQP